MPTRWDSEFRLLGVAMLGAAIALPALPPLGPLCPMRRLTGIPCPLCGMTTGVVATVHGDLGAGFAANPAAPLLVLSILVSWAWWALLLIRGLLARASETGAPGGAALAGRPRDGGSRLALLAPRARSLARHGPYPILGLLWLVELHRFGYL